jgi:hypothetical protein
MTARALLVIMFVALALAGASLALGMPGPAALLAATGVMALSLAFVTRNHRGSWTR